MLCPRCNTDLTSVSSLVDANLCSDCEGVWLSREVLEKCLSLPVEYLRNSPLWVHLEADHPDVPLEPMVACPACNRQMERFFYDDKSNVAIDACEKHGIWLDDGELSKILDYREHAGSSSGLRGQQRVANVSGGVWQRLARWFESLRARPTRKTV